MAENTKILLNKSDLLEVYPQKGETKSDFINRFMRVTGSEYPDVKQRYAVANSYWERRNKKGLKESDHTQKAIDALGITYYKTRAGFMLKDGRLLDLTYDGNPREDHRAIQDAFDDMDLETASDYLIEFMNEGNIRLIPELPGIDITMPPTHEQWLALKDYVQYWINKKHHFEIQFSNEIGQQVDWKEFNGFTSVNEILYTIADHFGLKLIESIEPHQNDKTYSKYIINPEENYDLASKITPIINKHQNIIPMKRDHCLEINHDLLFDLENAGYKFELVSGYFICDNVNITDLQDLKTLKKYNEYKQSGLSIPEFVIKNDYLGKEKGWFTYIPHWWLQLGGLIVDRAWPMFKKALEKPITAENYTLKDFNESFMLHEDTRAQLISKSRNADLYKNPTHGKNRFERKKYSKVASQVKSFNQIDMNKFFKRDILEVNIPVVGETDTYTVTIRLDGVVAEIAKNIKANNNKFEFRTVVQALTKVFNSSNNVRVKCTCLTGDTEIKLLDGTSDTIENLAKRYNNGEKLYVYAVDSNGDFKPGEVSKVWQTGIANKLIKVTLDNGKEIKTTPDHLYMLRDGSYARADTLRIGQSLMPLYTSTTENGYETVKFNSTGKYHSTYKIVGEYYYSEKIAEKTVQAQQDRAEGKDKMHYDVAIHHKDFDKANNYPENLEIMTGYEHWLYHANTIERLWSDPEFRKANSERSSKWMTWLNQHPTDAMIKARHSQENIDCITAHNYDPEWLEKQSVAMSNFMKDYWKNLSEEERARRSKTASEVLKTAWERGCFNTDKWKAANEKRKAMLHTPEIEQLSAEGVRHYWANLEDEEREAVIAQRKANLAKGAGWNKGKHLSEEDRKNKSIAALSKTPEEKQARALKFRDTSMLKVFNKIIEEHGELTAENYEYYRAQFFPRSPKLTKYFKNVEEAVSYFKINHKIVKVEELILDEAIPVYDIAVDNFHNFAVNAGVILHNCDDFKYRFAHQLILNNNSVDGTDKDPGPGKTGMANTQGKGCKHILLALNNQAWLMKVVSVLHNYVNYSQEHMQKAFLKIIFPKLYGIPADAAIEENLVPEDTNLDTEKHIIDVINDWAKNRGKYRKGENRNPINDKRNKKEGD